MCHHHEYEVAPRPVVVGLLENRPDEEGVLCESLHGPNQDVKEAEAVAVALGLAPLYIS